MMQAIWICVHLHGASSSASSVVGNTAAMTIRQVVSLAFGKVGTSLEAKHVGVLVFQELCFMSREENGVWLKRSAVSPMGTALAVELLETILGSHAQLFREDPEFNAIMKQHVCSLVQSALEMGCNDRSGGGSSSLGGSSLSASTTAAPFFPLLVRATRLASTVLCNFCDVLPKQCEVVLSSLLEIVATGTYSPVGAGAKSPSGNKLAEAKASFASSSGNLAKEAKNFLTHASTGSSSTSSTSASSSVGGGNFVTWPVLLSLEVLNRLCLEPTMIEAMANYPEGGLLVAIVKTTSSVIATSPPIDFKSQGTDAAMAPRSGLELLNDQDSPPLQQFYNAVRIAVICQCNLLASVFELSRVQDDAHWSAKLANDCIMIATPSVLSSLNCVMRYCREVDLITMSLKSYHVLATIASRLRSNMQRHGSTVEVCKHMDEVVLACLRALCTFSFPLPDSIRSNTRSMLTNGPSSGNGSGATSIGSSGPGEFSDESSADDGESCLIVISWREVHAMKALFGAAHIMEEELSEQEWCVLLEGFEIIMGLTDTKLKNGQQKIPTKSYRISAFRVEDEDVEQQLLMLANSIADFFRDALKLSSAALRKLLAAVQKVSWDEVGFPLPSTQAVARATSSYARSHDGNGNSTSVQNGGDADSASLPVEAAWVSVQSGDGLHAHHLKIYHNFLGVGLAGSGAFVPCFALRMLTQMASSSKRCFEEVVRELLLMTTFVPQPPLSAAQFPQLNQFQVFTTDSILQLMQTALQNAVNSLSPVAKVPNQATLAEIEAFEREHPSLPHVFDQEELFEPLLTLVRSELKDRALHGILELLNSSGHLVNTGWPLILRAIQEAGEVGDNKTQVIAFKCLRLVVDDLLATIPTAYIPDCIRCIGRFGACAKDVNISLTAVNELWSVADVVGKQTIRLAGLEVRGSRHWACVFREFSNVALDDRAEVRNCAINTLFQAAVTYGAQFELSEWKQFIDDTVLPLARKLYEGQQTGSASASPIKPSNEASKQRGGPGAAYMLHHSRDSAEKQWNESRVLMLTGVSRVLQTNWHYLVMQNEAAWFSSVWRHLLQHVAINAEAGMSKEVVLAAVNALQTLLQVSSAGDFDQVTQSQPVRAGAGMRVVGGALVSSSSASPTTPSAGHSKRAHSASGSAGSGLPVRCDPVLWEEAFDQLLRLCDERHRLAVATDMEAWKEEDEQDIASAVVSVLVVLYSQSKEFEFKDVRNVEKVLDLFQVLVARHVLRTGDNASNAGKSTVTNITSNSLQSRVLNAFEDCGSFAAHPQVHSKMVGQLVGYVRVSVGKDLVFFTRHALTSLAKLYASVTPDARRECFLGVLSCIQPFMTFNDASSTTAAAAVTSAKNPSAAEKAATQLWKFALRVLLVLISSGLAAADLADSCWRPLLRTIEGFVHPHTGVFPPCVQSEEDEALVLSILECVVDSAVALLAPSPTSATDMANGADTHGIGRYTIDVRSAEFYRELLVLLSSGVDAERHNRAMLRCCVRQLSTLCLQRHDSRLADDAQARLVECCVAAMNAFAALERNASQLVAANGAEDALTTTIEGVVGLEAARERVVILLTSAHEVSLRPRSVLVMFPALCECILSPQLDVRTAVRALLVDARVADYCLQLVDAHERHERQ